MSSKLPIAGVFRITCIYGKKGNWKAGYHTGVDMVNDDKIIYSSCYGAIWNMGYDASYGNFIVIRANDGLFHWYCHLSKITCNMREDVTPESKIGIMGTTGNSTGVHLHYEIRNKSNKYGDTVNPCIYMGIPNKVGTYDERDYQVEVLELKTLARNTNLRNEPTISSSEKTLYLSNTTLYILEKSVAENDGFVWDKVKIRVNGKIGYMINKNYK